MASHTPEDLKFLNTRVVFDIFRKSSGDAFFAGELARKTKISSPTVQKILADLQEKELLISVKNETARVGRQPNLLQLNTEKHYAIGGIYEGEYLSLGAVDLAGRVRAHEITRVGSDFRSFLPEMIDGFLRKHNKDTSDLIGICVGLPGVYDMDKQEVTVPLLGYHDSVSVQDLITELEETYGTRVLFDNDLNLHAIGEFNALAKEGIHDLTVISLGTGLGAGIILDGKLRRGNRSICGEVGYTVLGMTDDEEGSYWLENAINLPALEKKFGLKADGSCSDREDAIDYVARRMACLINNLTVSLAIENVILDGIVLELLGEPLLDAIQAYLNAISFYPIQVRSNKLKLSGVTGAGLEVSNYWLNEYLKE